MELKQHHSIPSKQIRALYDEQTITVYQAYNSEIAQAAVKNQTFISPPYKLHRMTWIKPSFLWMMYRSGWASKEGQEHILQIKIRREGFEWALRNSCLSHFDSQLYSSYSEWKEKLHESPVRIQWDPERDIYLQPLSHRSLQIGLAGIAMRKYVDEWIVEIKDITFNCKRIRSLVNEAKIAEALSDIPLEVPYVLPIEIKDIIHASE